MSNLLNNVAAAPVVKASLIVKNGTANEWQMVNPTLIKGELGIEIDTGLLKVGNGTTPFNELQYINIPKAILDNSINTLNNQIEAALTGYMQKPSNFIENHLPIFNANGDLIDSGKTINEYIEGEIASDTVPGGVISSSDDNSVSVDENGKMIINRVSVSNLYVGEEDEFILSNGDSTN